MPVKATARKRDSLRRPILQSLSLTTLLAEYQFIGEKLPGGLIAEAGTQGCHAHIWSFTLDPVIDLFPERANSLYLTGGGWFYRKVAIFTEPGEYQNYAVGHFSSNQGGASFGIISLKCRLSLLHERHLGVEPGPARELH